MTQQLTNVKSGNRRADRKPVFHNEQGTVCVPLARTTHQAILDKQDFERLTTAQGLCDQWYLNTNGSGLLYVRAPSRPGDSRTLVSVANEIVQPGRNEQVRFRDGNRLNLRRSNLAVGPRRGGRRKCGQIDGTVYVPENDRS
jgi:hypothetical protein